MEEFVCCCFRHTADDICQDYLENGKSTIMEKIQMEKNLGTVGVRSKTQRVNDV